MTIETTKLYIFISTSITLIFFQGHSRVRNEKLLCPFSRKIEVDLAKFNVSVICGFVESYAKFVLYR